MAATIKVLLQDPDRPRYGLELMRLTGQPSGTLYLNLAKLECAGWITGGKEDIDPEIEGRPARHNYRIPNAAVSLVRQKLNAFNAINRQSGTRPHYARPAVADAGPTDMTNNMPSGSETRNSEINPVAPEPQPHGDLQ
jgi:DNA-binding PadR family transcriptional regulator